jgi:predicted regulator of Ras-like GTPase activity (Roadblock/LC7/MglB family)
MPFKAILKKLVEKTPGATGAILLDWEGEAVADFSISPDIDLPVIGAHKGIILNLTRDALTRLKGENMSPNAFIGDGIKTIGISTELAGVALSTVKEGYYLVVTVEKNKPLGIVFFESNKAIKDIEREMG